MTIFSVLKIPYKAICKILRIIKMEINEIKFPEVKRYDNLINSYNLVGVSDDREKHILRLNECLNSLGYPKYDENYGMYSEHLIIFSALKTYASPLFIQKSK